MTRSIKDSDFASLPALLVIAYLRPESLKTILETAHTAGIKRYFISIDFPRESTPEKLKLSSQVLTVANDFQKTSGTIVNITRRSKNIGCTPSVLSSCDWAFTLSENLIVLEDDCIPNVDFFNYCKESFSNISVDPNIWLACGTQLAPAELINDSWLLSRYPLTWGWCTTSNKWAMIRDALYEPKDELTQKNSVGLSFFERRYWNAGAQRALSGIADAWDTPLVQQMLRNNALAILPKYSLVSNVGNDQVATHTHGNAQGIKTITGSFSAGNSLPVINNNVENWLRDEFYKIKPRHSLTTRVTGLMDKVLKRKGKVLTLRENWENAKL
jgi:hypothetical protein